MKDLNNDGKIDETEAHLFHLGRTLSLCIAVILIMVIMAVFDKGTSSFPYICTVAGLYCGRSVGQDIANKRREQ